MLELLTAILDLDSILFSISETLCCCSERYDAIFFAFPLKLSFSMNNLRASSSLSINSIYAPVKEYKAVCTDIHQTPVEIQEISKYSMNCNNLLQITCSKIFNSWV